MSINISMSMNKTATYLVMAPALPRVETFLRRNMIILFIRKGDQVFNKMCAHNMHTLYTMPSTLGLWHYTHTDVWRP